MKDLRGLPVHAASREQFLAYYSALFEHSPWIVEQAWHAQPVADAAALHDTLLGVLAAATDEQRLALIRAHPELADKFVQAEGLTAASASEQASAGLTQLLPEEFQLFHDLNRSYRARFGFPFIICVRLHTKASILAAMQSRLGSDPETELREALTQIGLIVALRLATLEAP